MPNVPLTVTGKNVSRLVTLIDVSLNVTGRTVSRLAMLTNVPLNVAVMTVSSSAELVNVPLNVAVMTASRPAVLVDAPLNATRTTARRLVTHRAALKRSLPLLQWKLQQKYPEQHQTIMILVTILTLVSSPMCYPAA